MDSSDRKKLINAGFTIFRVQENSITQLNPSGSWKLFGKYLTKSSLNNAVLDLRKDEKVIFE